MERNTVYVDTTDPFSIAAGPVSVTGVYLRGGYEEYLKDLPPDTEQDKILEAIDKTFERPGNDLVQYFLWPSMLNSKNTAELILLKTELICTRLYYRSKVLPKHYVRRTAIIPASVHRSLQVEQERSVGTYIARWINKLRREQSITNHYINIYPEYELEENKGYKTPRHLDLIIQHGPKLDFHLDSAIDYIPKYFLSKVKNLEPGYTLQIPAIPSWWLVHRPHQNFFSSVKNTRVMTLLEENYQMPQAFQDFLTANSPFVEITKSNAQKSYYFTAIKKRKASTKRSIKRHAKLRRPTKNLGQNP